MWWNPLQHWAWCRSSSRKSRGSLWYRFPLFLMFSLLAVSWMLTDLFWKCILPQQLALNPEWKLENIVQFDWMIRNWELGPNSPDFFRVLFTESEPFAMALMSKVFSISRLLCSLLINSWGKKWKWKHNKPVEFFRSIQMRKSEHPKSCDWHSNNPFPDSQWQNPALIKYCQAIRVISWRLNCSSPWKTLHLSHQGFLLL